MRIGEIAATRIVLVLRVTLVPHAVGHVDLLAGALDPVAGRRDQIVRELLAEFVGVGYMFWGAVEGWFSISDRWNMKYRSGNIYSSALFWKVLPICK